MNKVVRDSGWRRHLIALVMVAVLVPLVLNIVTGGWVFYKQRVAAAKELNRLSGIPQVGMVPPHTEKVAEKRHAGERCFIRLCTGTAVSIEQQFLFSVTKSEIIDYYDRAFKSNGWGWSKGPKGVAYARGQSRDDCVLVVLRFEQETVYRLTYVPTCSWEGPVHG